MSVQFQARSLVSVLVLSVGAACQQETPIDPAQVSLRAAEDVAGVFHAAALSADGNRGARRAATRVGDGLTVMSRSAERVSTQPTSPPQPPPGTPAIRGAGALSQLLLGVPGLRAVARPLASESLLGPTPPPGSLFATAPDEADELASDLEETGDNLRRLLRERVLVASNIESRADGEVIYRLAPEPTCRDLDVNDVDEDCVEMLTKVEVRVRLTREGEGVRLELLVGRDRARPAALSIDRAQVAAALFLDGVKRAAAVISAANGEPDETPAVLRGAVRVALRKEGERKASLALSVTEAVEVEDKDDGGDAIRVKVAAADRALALTADGVAGTVTGGINLRAVEVLAPWQPDDARPSTSQMRLVLGGLSGQVTFTQARDDVKLTNLGLGAGPTYLEVRGQRIFQADLNERDGRVFATTITFTADGMPRLAIDPRFDLALAFKLAAVANDFSSPPASHLLDETYRFTLDPAAGQGPVLAPFDSPVADGDGLRVVSGKLTLASSKVSAPVTVNAGECLTSARPQPGQHPVLGSFAVVRCN